MKKLIKKIKNKAQKYLTAGRGGVDLSKSREIFTAEARDMNPAISGNQKAAETATFGGLK